MEGLECLFVLLVTVVCLHGKIGSLDPATKSGPPQVGLGAAEPVLFPNVSRSFY